MSRYLEVEAASFSLLIDAALVERVTLLDGAVELDLSRALGGGPAQIVVVLGAGAHAATIGVDAVHGFAELEEHEFAPLPLRLQPASGQDVDGVTRHTRNGAPAFRLKLARSSAASAR